MPGSTGGTQHKREFTPDTAQMARTRSLAAQRPTKQSNTTANNKNNNRSQLKDS